MKIFYWAKKVGKWLIFSALLVVILIMAIYIATYEGNYFTREHPNESGRGKYRFEDLENPELYFKQNYPKGSDVIVFILDATAAGAYCKEYLGYKDPEDLVGTKRYHCNYSSAFFSRNLGEDHFIIIEALNGKIVKIGFFQSSV